MTSSDTSCIMVIKLLLKDGIDLSDVRNMNALKLLTGKINDHVSQFYTVQSKCGVVRKMERDRGSDATTSLSFYFPKIYRNKDAIFNLILETLIRSLNQSPCYTMALGVDEWDQEMITFDNDPRPVAEFIEDLGFDHSPITKSDIEKAHEYEPTANIISLSTDRFDFLLNYFHELHRRKPGFFGENVLYIVCAFVNHRSNHNYSQHTHRHVTETEWYQVSRVFGMDDQLAKQYFDQTSSYAYTLVTMEEVLRRESHEIAKQINLHNSERLRHRIKTLIKQRDPPTYPDLWQIFVEFIRRNHFYADDHIYILSENCCIKRKATDMATLIDRFVNLIREGRISVHAEELAQFTEEGRPATLTDLTNHDSRIKEMIKPFTSSTRCRFVEEACKQYLHNPIKTGIRKQAIPFKDVVLFYDPKTKSLHRRKAFLEDQFTSSSPFPVDGFGKSREELDAIQEVKDTFFKMFANHQNVRWFIKWMGSLLAHTPERTCLIMYGPKGGNAKSTLATILIEILCDAATQCRPDMLIANQKGGQTCTPFDMDRMDRVLIVISEPQRNQVYSSSTVKDVTGGDLMKAAAKYKDPVQFQQTAKPVILSNHLVQFDEVDEPLLDRLYITNCIGRFTATASDDPETQRKDHVYPMDPTFWNELRKRALAHIMVHEGFPAYVEEGLLKTPAQVEELEKYKEFNDPYTKFYGGKLDTPGYTEIPSLYACFSKINAKRNIQVSQAEFTSNFGKKTGMDVEWSPDRIPCFKFQHKDCIDGRHQVL